MNGRFRLSKSLIRASRGRDCIGGGFKGSPRFEKSTLKGEYPFGEVQFSDPSIPLDISLTGWSPFIPLDDKNSGILCVILEYTLRNSSPHPVEYKFSYHLSHLAPGCRREQSASANTVISGKGIFFPNVEDANAEAYGSGSLTVIGYQPRIKGVWLRSPGWKFDALSALWREVSTGKLTTNEGFNKLIPAEEMELPFCWKKNCGPANPEPAPFSSPGTFPTVTFRLAASRQLPISKVKLDAASLQEDCRLPPL